MALSLTIRYALQFWGPLIHDTIHGLTKKKDQKEGPTTKWLTQNESDDQHKLANRFINRNIH